MKKFDVYQVITTAKTSPRFNLCDELDLFVKTKKYTLFLFLVKDEKNNFKMPLNVTISFNNQTKSQQKNGTGFATPKFNSFYDLNELLNFIKFESEFTTTMSYWKVTGDDTVTPSTKKYKSILE